MSNSGIVILLVFIAYIWLFFTIKKTGSPPQQNQNQLNKVYTKEEKPHSRLPEEEPQPSGSGTQTFKSPPSPPPVPVRTSRSVGSSRSPSPNDENLDENSDVEPISPYY